MAKKNTTYNRTVQSLNKMFKAVNEHYFNGELEMPTITIQSSARSYGHITTSKVWKNSEGKATYELNLSADYIGRDLVDTTATLIHEAVHLYHLMHGIMDVSKNGVYHNKVFKAKAEQCGLAVEKSEKYGFSHTSATEETLNFVLEYGFQDIEIERNVSWAYVPVGGSAKASEGETPKAPKKKSSSIKWVCPCCGAIVRSTKELNIVCGDCNERFIKAE